MSDEPGTYVLCGLARDDAPPDVVRGTCSMDGCEAKIMWSPRAPADTPKVCNSCALRMVANKGGAHLHAMPGADPLTVAAIAEAMDMAALLGEVGKRWPVDKAKEGAAEAIRMFAGEGTEIPRDHRTPGHEDWCNAFDVAMAVMYRAFHLEVSKGGGLAHLSVDDQGRIGAVMVVIDNALADLMGRNMDGSPKEPSVG